MALQNSLVPTVLGAIGTVCWCINLLPQIWSNYRQKRTDGLPVSMLILWAASGVLSGVYVIAQVFNISLVVRSQCFNVLYAITWTQCLIYSYQWRARMVIVWLVGIATASAATQVGIVFAIRSTYAQGDRWPVLTIGIIARALDLAGFLPLSSELLKRRGRVVGLSFAFLAVDWCGAFFSLISIATQAEFDVLFATACALSCIIEIGIATSHLVWLLRTRGVRKRAREAGKSFDEFDGGIQWQAKGPDICKTLSCVFKRQRMFEESIGYDA